MSRSSRYLACISYLLSLPGALFVLLARRDDLFAVYHARQSLRLAAVALLAPVAWVVGAWLLAWIPMIGGMLGVILFALLLAVYAGVLISWIAGMVYSLKGQVRPMPLFGTPSTRQRAPAPATTSESSAEMIERTTTSDA
ncbi:MAG TPA: hypothetical protein VFU22_21775 [Roseiflexaceae bacterium]|nr:hypothetical protein [Roseiflexaceae bacterium]